MSYLSPINNATDPRFDRLDTDEDQDVDADQNETPQPNGLGNAVTGSPGDACDRTGSEIEPEPDPRKLLPTT